jgi:hypothetical protein
LKRFAWLALTLLAAPSLHAQTIVGPPGVYTVQTAAPTTVEYGLGFVKISWGSTPGPLPTPTPVPPTPTPPPTPPPGPVKTADWLILLFDDAAMTPALADVKNSVALRTGLPNTKVTSFSVGTPDFARFQPYLAAKGLAPPVFLFMQSATVLSAGTITTDADLLKAAGNLR